MRKVCKTVSELKILCGPELEELCNNVGLSKNQKNVIMCRIGECLYVPETSEKLGICESSVKYNFSLALKRIESYKNFLQKNK